MKLYSKRRLISTDLHDLLLLVSDTRGQCGYMLPDDVRKYLADGIVYGVFCKEMLCGVAFCGTIGDGFCIDKFVHDIAIQGSDILYIRMRCFETQSICMLLEPPLIPSKPTYIMLHYLHIDSISHLLSNTLELSAIRGGVGNKPYMLLQSGVQGVLSGHYVICPVKESKELSRLLEHNYRAVGALGNKLILAEFIVERNLNGDKTKNCGA